MKKIELNDVISFLNGEWVECHKVESFFGMTFSECFHRFDFSRTATWLSIAGNTSEERSKSGQCILCFFRLKRLGGF